MSLFQPWSLADLVSDLRSGATTPRDAVARARDRIEATDGEVQAWVETNAAGAPAATGLLRGVPLGVKDIIDLRGYATRCGSSLRSRINPSETDASIVSAWRKTGAIAIGKTVTTEFAFFSPGPTANPAAPGHTPGGSSSGSAAAVAAGQVPLALGSQTAGSVTRPASFCGVAALVMSHGRFPTDGIVGLSPSFDSHGVFAAGSRDLCVAWSALTGETITQSSRPRLLLWDAGTLGEVSECMRSALDQTVWRLRAEGATIDEFTESALVAEVTEAHKVVMGYEAAHERSFELAHAEQLSAPLRGLLEDGARTSDADYSEACALIARARTRLRAVLSDDTALIGAAALGAAPEGLAATGDPVASRAWQAVGLPVVAVPGLRDTGGRPLGIQLIGAMNSEARLLAHSTWVQERLTR